MPLGGSNLLTAQTRNTNGSFTVIQCDVPPQQGSALHIHTPGACIFGPRGIPHSFQNVGDTPGRLLAIYTPAGVERFFQQYAELLPGPVHPDAFAAIADTNRLEFIGPPLAVSDPL
jgi:hypothetical protein